MKVLHEARVLTGFDDPALSDGAWARTLDRGPMSTVFLTLEYQRAWWSAFGRGELLLISVERGGEPAALAPLFADDGMVFFVGSGGSDTLDFVGDTSDPMLLDALLESAREQTPDFRGFLFYHVPDQSPTGQRLRGSAERLGLRCVEQESYPMPVLDLGDTEAVRVALRKKSLLRHERGFLRAGGLEVEHIDGARDILPRMERFFDQHERRWAGTESPSLFRDPAQRRFYATLVEEAAGCGWLRFTEIRSAGLPIAFHLGFHYRGRYLWYKPTFEIELARRSPGEVLLLQLLRAAVMEGAEIFDFGLGDEAFKQRFANRVETVRSWGLYP